MQLLFIYTSPLFLFRLLYLVWNYSLGLYPWNWNKRCGVVSALQHNTSWSSLQCSYISENLRERGCDRKDVVILIIPAMTQPTRQVPQRSEAYFSPQLRREMTQWNLGHSHLTKYKLTWFFFKKKCYRICCSTWWAVEELALWIASRHL